MKLIKKEINEFEEVNTNIDTKKLLEFFMLDSELLKNVKVQVNTYINNSYENELKREEELGGFISIDCNDCGQYINYRVHLTCGHLICKDCLIKYAISLCIQGGCIITITDV